MTHTDYWTQWQVWIHAGSVSVPQIPGTWSRPCHNFIWSNMFSWAWTRSEHCEPKKTLTACYVQKSFSVHLECYFIRKPHLKTSFGLTECSRRSEAVNFSWLPFLSAHNVVLFLTFIGFVTDFLFTEFSHRVFVLSLPPAPQCFLSRFDHTSERHK